MPLPPLAAKVGARRQPTPLSAGTHAGQNVQLFSEAFVVSRALLADAFHGRLRLLGSWRGRSMPCGSWLILRLVHRPVPRRPLVDHANIVFGSGSRRRRPCPALCVLAVVRPASKAMPAAEVHAIPGCVFVALPRCLTMHSLHFLLRQLNILVASSGWGSPVLLIEFRKASRATTGGVADVEQFKHSTSRQYHYRAGRTNMFGQFGAR